jgi:hypothetical protein
VLRVLAAQLAQARFHLVGRTVQDRENASFEPVGEIPAAGFTLAEGVGHRL